MCYSSLSRVFFLASPSTVSHELIIKLNPSHGLETYFSSEAPLQLTDGAIINLINSTGLQNGPVLVGK